MPTLHPFDDNLQRLVTETSRQFKMRLPTTIDATGEALLVLPEEERLWWLVYLLKTLDRAPESVGVLERLRTSINERLASGEW